MNEIAVDAQLAVKLAGAVFLLLGASFAGFGLWAEEFLITVAGGFAGATGLVLVGLSPRMDEVE